MGAIQKRRGEREESLPEKWPLGIGGIYPHYSGDDGLFSRGREKEGIRDWGTDGTHFLSLHLQYDFFLAIRDETRELLEMLL
jgi:hypothetical protein